MLNSIDSHIYLVLADMSVYTSRICSCVIVKHHAKIHQLDKVFLLTLLVELSISTLVE